MATENVTGTEYNDWLDGGDGENIYQGLAGDDWINGADGQNTIVYNLGDGIDTISYAPPRSYQFAGFLEEIERALAEDSFATGSYSNSYFADASSALYDRLPADIRDLLNGFRSTYDEDGNLTTGTVDGQTAHATFLALQSWINTSVTNVVEFGSGITLADLTAQASATSSFDAPATFSIAVGGSQGVVFNMVPPDLSAAGDAAAAPPPMDIVFRFADGTTATLAEVLAQTDGGVAGYNNGSDAGEAMTGSLADDQIYGNGGDDLIDGRAGMDYLSGGTGNDVIAGGAGGDLIYGDDGDDVIAGGRDGATVGGGAGNDVYLFNIGDGALFVDNTPGVLGGEVDTLSFGVGIAPENVVAYVDEYGTLTLMVQGTSDQVLINWYMNNYDGTYSLRPDQVVPRVQFVGASGNVRVFDLEDLVGDRQGELFSASAASPIHLFGTAEEYAQYEIAGAPVAGGEYATRYAVSGDMFATTPPPGNSAPEVGAAIGNQSAVEGQPLVVDMPADAFTDADADALTYSATLANGDALPLWLQFNSQTGQLTGTPEDEEVAAGTLSIVVTASDGNGGSASQTFDLSIQSVNDAPQAAAPIVSAQATEDAAFQFSLPAGFFSDADVGELLNVSADAADMPQWLSFDPATMTFSGTPTNDDVGAYSVTVTATDSGGLRTSTEVSISVANTNDAPTVANEVGNYVIDEDAEFSMQVPANMFADVDANDTMRVTVDGVPQWANYDPATGTISGTPGNADVGSYTLTLTAIDAAGASVQESFGITVVNVNDAPTLDHAIADQAASEDSAFSFTVPTDTFGDVDADDALTLSVGALPEWLSFDPATGTFSGTAGNADVGSVSVTVTATDLAGASESSTFSIGVANTNDAPTLESPLADQVADEGSPLSFSLPAGAFADMDSGDALTLTATLADGSELPSWLSFDAANGSFSGTPDWQGAGSLSIRVTATDSSGASMSDDFDLTVNDVNTAPVVANQIQDQTATEGEQFTFAVPDDVFVDAQSDPVTLSATLADGSPLPAWLTFASPFTGTPDDPDVGTVTIVVTATDSAGLKTSTSFNLNVTNVNDAPTGGVTISGVATESQTLTADTGTIADADRLGAFRYQWLRGGTAIAGASERTYTLSDADVGSQVSVQVSYTDGFGTEESLTSGQTEMVLDAGDPPTVDPDQYLRGGRGNDLREGGSGNDTLDGRGGKDVLRGMEGNDTLRFYRDSTWSGRARRTHNGSPDVDGTGASVSIAGKRRSYDIFDGGDGVDTVRGSNGSDAILLDDGSVFGVDAKRLIGIEVIDARDGDDVVDLTSQRFALGNLTVHGGDGNDTIWLSSGNDVGYGDFGNDTMDGGAGNDYLSGGSGRDTLRGGPGGNDVLLGGSNDDNLSDWGHALLDAGSGNDTIADGAGNSMIIGGTGNDTIRLGGGFDVIAFNRGDGRDEVQSGNYGDATVSLGRGIRIQDLAFRRSGQDLILETGNRESITFEDWYRGRAYRAVSTLQLITEGMSGPSAFHDDPIEQFDFRGLVSAFDAARSRNPGLSKWALTNGMASFDLGGSSDEALGGDLASQYGRTGSLAGISLGAAQDVLADPGFGSDTQRLQAFQVLEEGLVKLA